MKTPLTTTTIIIAILLVACAIQPPPKTPKAECVSIDPVPDSPTTVFMQCPAEPAAKGILLTTLDAVVGILAVTLKVFE